MTKIIVLASLSHIRVSQDPYGAQKTLLQNMYTNASKATGSVDPDNHIQSITPAVSFTPDLHACDAIDSHECICIYFIH